MGIGGAEDEPNLKFAAVQVEYRMPEFLAVSVILKAMQEKKISPVVHLWDEEAEEPEVAVLFRIQNPGLELIKKLIAKRADALAEAVYKHGGCSEVITTGEANVPRFGGVEKFMKEFGRTGVAGVIVRETEESANYDPLATFKFRITSIVRGSPESWF
jgi:hypothetical protein